MVETTIRLRPILSALVLGLLGFSLWLFWPKLASSDVDVTGPPAAAVSVPPVVIDAVIIGHGDLEVTAEATGYLEAWRRLEVRPEITGRVVALPVRESTWIEQGSLLFRLDDQQSRLELAEAEADWLKVKAQFAVDYLQEDERAADPAARSRIEEIERAYLRAKDRFDQGLIAREAFEQERRRRDAAALLLGSQRERVQSASSGLLQTEHRVERLRLALARSRIEAAFAGRVADVEVEIGQQVAAGEACLTLLDDSRMKVEVEVLESDFVHLRPGAAAWVRVPSLPQTEIEGRVFTVNPQVDPVTGTGQVTVEIPNLDRRLVAGLFSYVDLETRRLHDVLLVPADAVLERQGRQLVFRVVDGRALWTYVDTGVASRGMVEVLDGLDAGDMVAVGRHFALAHESPVDVERLATSAVTADP